MISFTFQMTASPTSKPTVCIYVMLSKKKRLAWQFVGFGVIHDVYDADSRRSLLQNHRPGIQQKLPLTSQWVALVSNSIPLRLPTNSILSFPLHIMYISDDSVSNKQTYGVYLFHVVKEKPICLTISWFSYHSCRVLCGQQTKSPTKSPSRYPTKTPTAKPVSCQTIYFKPLLLLTNSILSFLHNLHDFVYISDANISNKQTYGVYLNLVREQQLAWQFVDFCVFRYVHCVDNRQSLLQNHLPGFQQKLRLTIQWVV